MRGRWDSPLKVLKKAVKMLAERGELYRRDGVLCMRVREVIY